jgi:hypothetical protein
MRAMASPADGLLRAVRTLAIAAVVVGLAATAHVAGGGEPPRPLAVAGAGFAAAYVFAWASRRRLSVTAIAALLGAGQWALHHVFELLQASACVPPLTGRHAGHATEGMAAACTRQAGDAASGVLAAQHASPAWAMLAAHVAATAATALVLASGERAVWALCGLLAALLPAVPRRVVVPGVPTRQAPAAAPVPRPRRSVLLRVSPRRGPPAGATRPPVRLAAV